jgi:hypothetical protein
MITLKGSKFVVSQDENATSDVDYKVFVMAKGEFKDVTDSLTQEETTELISDLIYAISDLIKGGVDNAG